MNQQNYLRELAEHLSKLPAHEIAEILADYKEHFELGIRAGKSEEQIAESLGHPRIVGQSHLVTSLVQEAQRTPSTLRRSGLLLQILIIFLILAPFNFLVFFGPFLILLALVCVGWTAPLVMSAAGLCALAVFLFSGGAAVLSWLQGGTLLFMLLGTIGLAALFGLLMLAISRGFIRVIASYIRWNFNFIRARST